MNPGNRKITDIGGVKDDGSLFHKDTLVKFIQYLNGTEFICGHNLFDHDLKYIGKAIHKAGVKPENIVDTLVLSPLLFPAWP